MKASETVGLAISGVAGIVAFLALREPVTRWLERLTREQSQELQETVLAFDVLVQIAVAVAVFFLVGRLIEALTADD